MMKSLLKLCLVFSFVGIALYAQKDANEQLAVVQNKYKSVNDLSVDFKQSVSDKSYSSGKLIYAKGNRIRIELNKMTIISDGNTLWNYNASKKQVIINNADNDEQSFFSIDNFVFQYPAKCIVSSQEDNGKTVLVLIPKKNSGLDFKKAMIWTGKDNLITCISVENLAGTIMNIELSGYALNKNIPDSKFSFAPPEGIKVIDLRK